MHLIKLRFPQITSLYSGSNHPPVMSVSFVKGHCCNNFVFESYFKLLVDQYSETDA